MSQNSKMAKMVDWFTRVTDGQTDERMDRIEMKTCWKQ